MNITKTVGQGIGYVRAVTHLLRFWVCKPLLGSQRAFIAASERAGRAPGYLGLYARQAFYRHVLARVGRDVYFGYMSLFSKAQATVGDRVYIGRFCTIGWVEIGDDVMLADGVQILSGRHQHGRQAEEGQTRRDHEQAFTKVTIGQGAWLGAGAIVMADVGDGAVVGAGAVVTKPVKAGARVGGVPAQPLAGVESDAPRA